jgi:16S rRNA (guanine966-N2)-methyltransferase
MRVVAGSARRRTLVAPGHGTTRPTSDRVREATFNALASMGAIEGAAVVDLFAGSGAMGIEALSRGAAHATFVDDDPRALEAVKANLATTGLAGRAHVVGEDALRYLRRAPRPFGLAVLDPPYGTPDGRWDELLAALDAEVVVLEAERPVEPGPAWQVQRIGRYGTTVVTVARRKT